MNAIGADYLLTVADVCERLGIGRTQVYALMATGDLPSLQIGRSRRIRASALDEFIARRESLASHAHASDQLIS